MKIDENIHSTDLLTSGADHVAKNKAEQVKDNMQTSEKSGPSNAEVTFSKTSVESAKVREAMEVESPERAAKIREIQAQIQNGTYHVSGAEVADKVLKEVLSDFVES